MLIATYIIIFIIAILFIAQATAIGKIGADAWGEARDNYSKKQNNAELNAAFTLITGALLFFSNSYLIAVIPIGVRLFYTSAVKYFEKSLLKINGLK